MKSSSDGGEFWALLASLKGAKFDDNEFPAAKESLITDWNEDNDEVKESAADWKTIEWLRTDQIPELNDKEGKL